LTSFKVGSITSHSKTKGDDMQAPGGKVIGKRDASITDGEVLLALSVRGKRT